MVKILVADGIDAEGLGRLNDNNSFNLVFVDQPEQIKKEIVDADALLVRSKTKVTLDLLSLSRKLRFVGRAGVGVDNIDVNAASKKGIVVANVPGGNTISAAEHTFALILALSRNIPQSHA
jgi:D-3-phosphoglycerate dehydrogenase